MTPEGTVHALSQLVARSERPTTIRGLFGGATRMSNAAEQHPTRGLSKWIDGLGAMPGPVVVDLGPAIGVNVTFLGERLGCKLHVEDVLSNLDIWGAPAGDGDVPPVGTEAREEAARRREALQAARTLPRETGSIDGVLCWDVLDYLDRDAAAALAGEVVRMVRPGGLVFVRHGTSRRPAEGPVQYEIVDEMTLRHREAPSGLPERRVWESRAVTRMFPDLAIRDSFLLTNQMRELVLRREGTAISAGDAPTEPPPTPV